MGDHTPPSSCPPAMGLGAPCYTLKFLLHRRTGCHGTRRYMSPEILTAESFPHKMSVDSLVRFYVHADVYAMALVIWEMCRRTVTDTGNWEICI